MLVSFKNLLKYFPFLKIGELNPNFLVLNLPLKKSTYSKRPNNYVKTSRYTIFNFLFKCFLEQFRIMQNVYFLFIILIELFGTYFRLFDSPYTYVSTLLGLSLVLAFTMTFEGYYDIKRHKEDKLINSEIAYRLRPGDSHLQQVPWAELRPGDFVKVHDRSAFPADLIFISNCSIGKRCYVETSNIDGETNLKIRHIPKKLVNLCVLPDQVASLKAQIKVESPSPALEVSGSIRVFHDTIIDHSASEYTDIPFDESNILLRGCVLRNTPWILGIVLYAGPETKLVQSSNVVRSKLSRLHKYITITILFVLCLDLILCVTSAMVSIWGFIPDSKLYYLKITTSVDYLLPRGLGKILTFVILYSSLLPLSLLFSLTFCNFSLAMFIRWDIDMYDSISDISAKCNSMELVQELGQVSYLLTDKTGTLTRNEMKLVGISVNGKTFGLGNNPNVTSESSIRDIFSDVISIVQSKNDEETKTALINFMLCLAVCHTVIVDTSLGTFRYNAEGPDEEALVGAVADIGARMISGENNSYSIHVDFSDKAYSDWMNINCSKKKQEYNGMFGNLNNLDNTLKFQILAINRFNSVRKRMSVVCRRPDGQIILYVKGADSSMFEIERNDNSADHNKSHQLLLEHLHIFATDGLRTLVVGQREISEEEYIKWKVEYDSALFANIHTRFELLNICASKIECDIDIIGITGIEDRLQDGVPDTLMKLREAGVKVWVLTGDKIETAINIAFASQLFPSNVQLIRIISEDKEENINTVNKLHALLIPKNLAKDSKMRKIGRKLKNFKKEIESKSLRLDHFDIDEVDTADSISKNNITLNPHKSSSQFHTLDTTISKETLEISKASSQSKSKKSSFKTGFQKHFLKSRFFKTWHKREKIMLPGIDRKDEFVNQVEVKGDEKNLDNFETTNLALVISGKALDHLLNPNENQSEKKFTSIARICSVVVACRVSPKQKALLVQLVKKSMKISNGNLPITMAIGDGANDVAMIQEAHIGVGISGKEGRQATNNADFSIGQFRFLQQLMFVHGRWNYKRVSTMVLFVFYSNILFVFTTFVFNFFNKFSGSPLYFSFLTIIYAYPTQIPIVFMAIFNRDISKKTALTYPAVYVCGRKNLNFNYKKAILYISRAIIHGMVVSLVSLIYLVPKNATIAFICTTSFMACVWVCVITICFQTFTWTIFSVLTILFGFFIMFIIEPIYYSMDPSIFLLYGFSQIYGQYNQSVSLWICISISVCIIIYLELIFTFIKSEFVSDAETSFVEIDNSTNVDSDMKKKKLIRINQAFRKIAQPMTIPGNAISELLASSNIKGIAQTKQYTSFAFDYPEDSRLHRFVARFLARTLTRTHNSARNSCDAQYDESSNSTSTISVVVHNS